MNTTNLLRRVVLRSGLVSSSNPSASLVQPRRFMSSTSSSTSTSSSLFTPRNALIFSAVAATGIYALQSSEKKSDTHAAAAVTFAASESIVTPEAFASLRRDVDLLKAASKNRAFVFAKPHAADNAQVAALIRTKLTEAGIHILSEGQISYDQIDRKMLIDTHYGAIASKAVKLQPAQLNVPEKAKQSFQNAFGMTWSDALAQGKVYNALDACKKLGITGKQLDEMWSKLSKDKDLIKFGGGFYCGKIGDIFVINGFYMAMRAKYTEDPAKIHYYVVEWNPNRLSWADFRGKILGATDPKEAQQGSIRRAIFDDWKKLGLADVPNTGDNGVHASASPFEAMAERVNWLETAIQDDEYARGLLATGISMDDLKVWMGDAQVTCQGKQQSIFDLLEDLDADDVLVKIANCRN